MDNVTTPPLHVVGNRINVEAFHGKLKPVITVEEKGVVVWCRVYGTLVDVPYAELIRVREFREGVMAALASRQK